MVEIWKIFDAYCGSGIYPFLFLAALAYLLATEKDKKVRIVLLESSLVIGVLFFFPLFKRLMDRLDEGTYYRILWLLPMTVVIALAAVRLMGRHHRLGLALATLLLILTGQCVYRDPFMSKAQNRYHLPDSLIAICNEMMPGEEQERVWAVFPEELIHYVRQYSSKIQMPYGREMLESSWAWNWDTHPIFRIMREDTVDLDALAPLLTEYHCQYLVLNRGKALQGLPEENGLRLIAQIEAYDVYRYERVELFLKQNK